MPVRYIQTECEACPEYGSLLVKTGQTTQRDSELDDGYYESGVAKSFTANTSGAQSGTTNIDLIHLAANTTVSFDSGTKEIRGTGIMDVFKATGGDSIVVTGSTSNNGVFTTTSATADKIVVSEAVADESAGASVVIAKRGAISNNTVLDNNTGLEWTKSISSVFGKTSTGQMPWTGSPYDIFAYAAAANSASLGGYTDWRIPNIVELISIVDYETGGQAYVDNSAFDTITRSIWTSNTETPSAGNAYYFESGNGRVLYNTKTTSTTYYALLVRG